MARKGRTKKQYTDLYDDPTTMFRGCEVILFPNGLPEIWIRSADARRMFKIAASDGPAGLMLTIDKGIGGEPISAVGNLADEDWSPSGMTDFRSLSVCQYKSDEKSQAFKAWIAAGPDERGEPPSFTESESDEPVEVKG